jgi:hypothetical protein
MTGEMVRGPFIAAVVLGLVATWTATATAAYTVKRPDGAVRQKATAWAERSLGPLPREEGVILNTNPRAVRAACYGNTACTSPDWPSIYLDSREGSVRAVFFHELGHRLDYTVLTPARRARFQRLVGIPATRPWRGSANPPAERFAEAYGLCALGREPRLPLTPTSLSDWINGAYGYTPSVRAHRRVCRWLSALPGTD